MSDVVQCSFAVRVGGWVRMFCLFMKPVLGLHVAEGRGGAGEGLHCSARLCAGRIYVGDEADTEQVEQTRQDKTKAPVHALVPCTVQSAGYRRT